MDKNIYLARTTDLGRVSVSAKAIAQVVGHVTAESYGIVGMAGRRFPRLPGRDRITDGIDVKAHDDGVEIDLHVVVEYGLNAAEVAGNVRSQVSYNLERTTGLPVTDLHIHVQGVRVGEG